jgi:hypothetical protein
MRPSHGLLTAAAAIYGLSTWSITSATAQTAAHITTGEQGRFEIHTVIREGAVGYYYGHHFFLLDTRTAAVYTRIGQGQQWTQYAAALDIKAHPKGEEWKAPRFDLSIIKAPGAEPVLLLMNSSSGATYTRAHDGTWARYMRAPTT